MAGIKKISKVLKRFCFTWDKCYNHSFLLGKTQRKYY